MPSRIATIAAGLLLAAAGLAPQAAEAAPRGGGLHARAAAPTSIHGGNRAAGANRGDRTIVNRGGARTGDINIGNRTNINIDNDHHYDWDDHYHPVAAGVAFGTAAAVTSAVVGSMIYSLPPACSPYMGSYYYCGGVYYAPQYQGDRVVYVVVDRP